MANSRSRKSLFAHATPLVINVRSHTLYESRAWDIQ